MDTPGSRIRERSPFSTGSFRLATVRTEKTRWDEGMRHYVRRCNGGERGAKRALRASRSSTAGIFRTRAAKRIRERKHETSSEWASEYQDQAALFAWLLNFPLGRGEPQSGTCQRQGRVCRDGAGAGYCTHLLERGCKAGVRNAVFRFVCLAVPSPSILGSVHVAALNRKSTTLTVGRLRTPYLSSARDSITLL